MARTAPFLARVTRGSLCAGCGGCALVAPDSIEMAISPDGFLRPRQIGPVSAEDDAVIAGLCPGLGQSITPGDATDDTFWGPHRAMRTGWATDAGLRHAASSGGALSACLTHLLETGAVEGIVQTTAAPELPHGNVAVLSDDADAVQGAAGSRYAPSAPLAGLAPYLDGQGRFAFVGKPCDVAALRAYALVDPRVDARFPVMLSFFCAGVPSLKGAEAIYQALGVPADQVVAFRYRGNGWPGRATARLADGTEQSMTYHDSWGKILSKHLQHRCKICADGTGKAADLVCADAWETDERGYPLFEEQEGVSLIVVRTGKGMGLLEAAQASGHLETGGFDALALPGMQPGQYGRHRVLWARLLGLRLLGKPIPRYRGMHLRAALRHAPWKVALRNGLGMVRRVIQGRVRERMP